MRTAITAALLILVACGGSDDDGTDPGVDGGGDPFVGEYTATWSPERTDFVIGAARAVRSQGDGELLLTFAETLDFTTCDTVGGCLLMFGPTDGTCAAFDADARTGSLCLTGDGLSGAILDEGTAPSVEYTVTLTRR